MTEEIIENTVEDLGQTIEEYYDGTKRQRFEFSVTEGDATFDTAHVFASISDPRWMEFLRDQKVRGNADNVESNDAEAINKLWDDLIIDVENVELDSGRTLYDSIDFLEKKDAIEHYVAVAVFDPEPADRSSGGVRKLGGTRSRCVLTEAYQDGKVLRQEHRLRAKTIEDVKRYESILRRRFKQEQTRGLRRSAKIEFVPQDDKFAKLYDDMIVGVGNFANEFVPMRFKVAVIHHLFASELDEKKS